jgi:DNA helicase-2/ATP-dependent DNA helicase PcrA
MSNNHVDDWVDVSIQKCITEKKHFFMFAGAGSGKTRSLKNALDYIAREQNDDLSMKSKRVAVITYTNAACDEILRRVGYNHLFAVSTIHSFFMGANQAVPEGHKILG